VRDGDLRAIKLGSRTLIDVDAGLAWLRALPSAKIRPLEQPHESQSLNISGSELLSVRSYPSKTDLTRPTYSVGSASAPTNLGLNEFLADAELPVLSAATPGVNGCPIWAIGIPWLSTDLAIAGARPHLACGTNSSLGSIAFSDGPT
jgi:hypothetical protein